jgi:glutaredoxin
MSSTTEIIMYARERFCPDVTRSRLRLTELGVPWTEFDIEADEEAGKEAERLTGRRNVPTLIVGDKILVEPSNAQLDDALVAAGFDISDDD